MDNKPHKIFHQQQDSIKMRVNSISASSMILNDTDGNTSLRSKPHNSRPLNKQDQNTNVIQRCIITQYSPSDQETTTQEVHVSLYMSL